MQGASCQLSTHLYLHRALPVFYQHKSNIILSQHPTTSNTGKIPDITLGTSGWKMTRNLKFDSLSSVFPIKEGMCQWITTELQQSNAAIHNEVHRKGEGEGESFGGALKWLNCHCRIPWRHFVLRVQPFTTPMIFTDHIHQQDKPHQSALARKDDLCNTEMT